jgi:AraC family transcriptional regulator
MRMHAGEFFGEKVWERRSGGLILTLSVYRPGRIQPHHCHANTTLFLLLGGEHRDHSHRGHFDQPLFSLVYHPTSYVHASEYGSRGMRGLNIEYEPDWLERNELGERDLVDYGLLDSVQARLAGLRFVVNAFHSGDRAMGDLETEALELLEPLASRRAHSDSGPAPLWLRKVEEFLQARFRESVSLRHAAREAGVHPVYLARVFRRRHGCRVSTYLRTLRLMEACRLVMEGATLAHAAHGAGFSDQSHLSRCFSSTFGLPPKTLWQARNCLQA